MTAETWRAADFTRLYHLGWQGRDDFKSEEERLAAMDEFTELYKRAERLGKLAVAAKAMLNVPTPTELRHRWWTPQTIADRRLAFWAAMRAAQKRREAEEEAKQTRGAMLARVLSGDAREAYTSLYPHALGARPAVHRPVTVAIAPAAALLLLPANAELRSEPPAHAHAAEAAAAPPPPDPEPHWFGFPPPDPTDVWMRHERPPHLSDPLAIHRVLTGDSARENAGVDLETASPPVAPAEEVQRSRAHSMD